MSEPKTCPFCGKEDWYFEQGEEGDTNIACDWCGYKSTIFRTIGDAYRWWQTRPIEDDLRKRIAELEAMVERLIEAGDRLSDSLCTYPEEEKTIEVCNWNAIVAEYKEREK